MVGSATANDVGFYSNSQRAQGSVCVPSSRRNLGEKVCRYKSSRLCLLANCFSIIPLIINKSTQGKATGHCQATSTDLFTDFSYSGICEKRWKSIEMAALLSGREMHTAI